MKSPYIKAAATLVLAVITAVATAVGNGKLNDLETEDWVRVALVVLGGTAAVWWAQNGPAAPIIKAVLGAVTAGLTAWTVAWENDHVISQGEWLTIALAVGTALTAVYQLANQPST